MSAYTIVQHDIGALQHACLTLYLCGRLRGPQAHKGPRYVLLADRDAMIAQHKDVTIAKVFQHPALLLSKKRDAFKAMVGNIPE